MEHLDEHQACYDKQREYCLEYMIATVAFGPWEMEGY